MADQGVEVDLNINNSSLQRPLTRKYGRANIAAEAKIE